MLTPCGHYDLEGNKYDLHVQRCSKCGGTPPHPPGTKHAVDYFSDSEAHSLIVNAPGQHWRLMFQILFETGARIGEVIPLRKKDVLASQELGFWTEKVKPKIYQAVPISAELYNKLRAYASHLRDTTLFPYSYSGFMRALKLTAQKSRIDRPVHSHMFRHGLARRIGHIPGLTASEALTTAQKILRHKRLQTTMGYFESTDREAKANLRKIQDSPWLRAKLVGIPRP